MKNKKKMIFVGIALILLVIVGVVAVNISKKASQREEIARQLELGKKQLTSLEYEEAIATFKKCPCDLSKGSGAFGWFSGS